MNDQPDWKRMGWPHPPRTGAERKLLQDIVRATREHIAAIGAVVDDATTPEKREKAINLLTARMNDFRKRINDGAAHCGFQQVVAAIEGHLQALRAGQ